MSESFASVLLPTITRSIPPNLPGFTTDFRQVSIETPRALRTNEIPTIIENFGQAARNAMSAGFDGVELQASNSHLIDQFLEDGTNMRTDEFGGTITNRVRFLIEIVDLLATQSDRIGLACASRRSGSMVGYTIAIRCCYSDP